MGVEEKEIDERRCRKVGREDSPRTAYKREK